MSSARISEAAAAIVEQGSYGTVPPGAAASAAVKGADVADLAEGVLRLRLDEEALDKMAEAMAMEGDGDDCFDLVRAYRELDRESRRNYDRAHGYPSSEYESCAYWRRKASAAAAALVGSSA